MMLRVSPSGCFRNRIPFGALSSPFGSFVSGEALIVIIAIGYRDLRSSTTTFSRTPLLGSKTVAPSNSSAFANPFEGRTYFPYAFRRTKTSTTLDELSVLSSGQPTYRAISR